MTLHASKGLEFPVVYMLAVEQGLLPHERSVGNTEEEEEERRLCFVGMTRAMKELYLCSARMRERRGQINYTIPSIFLQELPREVKFVDASGRNRARSAADEYRAKIGPAASDWADTGAQPYLPPPKPKTEIKQNIAPGSADEFALDAVVQHAEYGFGKVVEATGYGALRKVKVQFAGHGTKVFAGATIPLKVIKRKA
jgi:DNA helicase-2/ATP-dependent DNA helicase PcrA